MKKVILFILIVFMIISCEKKKLNEIKYVSAESGLNYRDKPNGKKLGKFDFNDKCTVDTITGVFQTVKDNYSTIKGQWVGTKVNNQRVFVFDGFLADTITKSSVEIDAITESKIKEFLDKKQRKPYSEVEKENDSLKKLMTTTYAKEYDYIDQDKWVEHINEGIKSVKDTVVITSEVDLVEKLKSNRVFLIDTPILDFYDLELYYRSVYLNNHFYRSSVGDIYFRYLKNVEFIGRKQRVYIIAPNYDGNSLFRIESFENFVFKNFCFYYPTIEDEREKQKENLYNEDKFFYALRIVNSKKGKFVNCNISGIGFSGVDILSHSSNITFDGGTFTNIQKNVMYLNNATNIVLNNITIENNNCESIIQMKKEKGEGPYFRGSYSSEKINMLNCKIRSNKVKKIFGFGKSDDYNSTLSSDIILKKCEITNNSFRNTFLDFGYQISKSAKFYNCKINDNKIYNAYGSPYFVTNGGGEDYPLVMFTKTKFKNNDWKITNKERKWYFK